MIVLESLQYKKELISNDKAQDRSEYAIQAGADATVGDHKPAVPQYDPNKQFKDNTNVVRYYNLK